MTDSAERYEAFLDELGPVVDGDPEALARHADFLADDDDARDLRHEAAAAAEAIALAGADYEPPADFTERLLATLDAQDAPSGAGTGEPGRTTNPGYFAPGAATDSSSVGPSESELPEGERSTEPSGFGPPGAFSDADIPATPAPAGAVSGGTVSGHPGAGEPSSHATGPLADPGPLADSWNRPASSEAGVAATRVRNAPTEALSRSEVSDWRSPSQADSSPGSVQTAPGPLMGTQVVPNSQEIASQHGGAQEPRPRKWGKLLLFPVVGALALAAAAAVGLVLLNQEESSEDEREAVATVGLEGILEHIDRASNDGQSGITIRRPGSDDFVALRLGEAVPAGSALRTDDRTRARVALSDESEVVLNHSTELLLVGDVPRGFSLSDGEVVADIAHLDDGPNAAFETPSGRVDVLGTKFVLTATDGLTSVRVSRGVVSVASDQGEQSHVNAGEEGVLRPGQSPSVAPVTNVASSMAWSELGAVVEGEDLEDQDAIAGIGSLRARRPGERSEQERPLTLARHDVRVRIVGNVARTEIEEVFRNDSDQVLEGIYKFPLPADAQIARLALDVDGEMEEGAFVERDRASRIWAGVIRNATPVRQRQNDEEFIWVPGPWRDPAILEWQRGGQFELRVFPIPAHGERRVILAYTQTVAPQGSRRRYVYPMAHSADDSTRVGEFNLDIRVAGAENVQANGYRVSSSPDQGATRLRFQESDFSPKGDLVIDYTLPGGERPLRWWTYQGDAALAPPDNARDRDREVLDLQRQMANDDRPYVAFALRPDLPRASQRSSRDYVLLVDSSQSMVGERYQRAARLTAHLVREMDRRDRFMVLACDYQCRSMPGGMQTPTAQASVATSEWLGSVEPAGASDLVAALSEASAIASGERREGRELHVMYVGDGSSSVGYRRAAPIATEVRAMAEREHVAVSAVGIGGDADTMVLRALARSGGGHYVPYVPGQRISVAALGVLETSYGSSLESPRLELPSGISQVAPAELPTIRAGQEVIVVGRMDRPNIEGGVVLRGNVGGQPFEQTYEVSLEPTTSAGNRFVPQLWAAGQIEQMQLGGRGEDQARIIATSKAFGVLSRHTSLLVLESEAMFRAFRVDRREATAQWTGEEDVVAGEAGESSEDGAGAYGTVGMRGRRSGGGYGPGGGDGSGMGGLAQQRAGALGGGRVASVARPEPRPTPSRPMGRAPAPPADMPASASRADDADMAGVFAERENQNRAQPQEPPAPITTPQMPTRRRGPGQWMRRVSYRAANLSANGAPSPAEERRADEAEAALEENLNSRDRHREAVRQLAQVGRLSRALEVAELWIARDRQDPEALTAKADLLGRMGQREEALRLLTGTVDLAPNSESLHRRLAGAFERSGRPDRACAHRIALAEIDESDPELLAAAMRCERSLERPEAAERLLTSVREASVRTRAERLLSRAESVRPFRGDFTVRARWSGDDDIDVTILTSQGTRLSWMGGRTTVVGEDSNGSGEESLGLRWTAPGTYIVEVNRTDPSDTREISGSLELRVLGERRTVPFRLVNERAPVARVRVTRETRMERVTGTVW